MAKRKPVTSIPLFEGSATEVDPFEPRQQTKNRDTRNLGLLALDIATTTGWCAHDESGIWDCTHNVTKPKIRKHLGELEKSRRPLLFMKALVSMVNERDIKLIVYEAPFVYKSKKRRPNFAAVEMIGCLKMLCVDREIKLVKYITQHIKQFATGRGDAQKEDMVRAATIRYGVTPADDNEADSLHLYHLATESGHKKNGHTKDSEIPGINYNDKTQESLRKEQEAEKNLVEEGSTAV